MALCDLEFRRVLFRSCPSGNHPFVPPTATFKIRKKSNHERQLIPSQHFPLYARTLIERSGVRPVDPRILQRDGGGAVIDHLRELSALEEWLVEPEVEEGVQAGVDVYPSRRKRRGGNRYFLKCEERERERERERTTKTHRKSSVHSKAYV